MQRQPGFNNLYDNLNPSRLLLRECEAPVSILGISQMLEDRSPAIDVHINRYVNRTLAAETHIDVSSRSAETSAVESAQRAEDFDYSFFADITRQKVGGIMPWRRHIDDAVGTGMGFLALRLKPEIKEKLGTDFNTLEEMAAHAQEVFKDGFTANPFIVECPAQGTVYYDPNFDNVCEIGVRVLSALLASYGGGPGTAGRLDYTEDGFEYIVSETMPEYRSDWDNTVIVYHLETKEYIYDIVEHPNRDDAFELEVRPNIIGRPWYTMLPGNVNNNTDIGQRNRPLIWPLYNMVQSLNVQNTLIQSGALNTGRPMYQEVADSGRALPFQDLMSDRSEQAPAIVFDPGETVLPKPKRGHHWELVPVPDMRWVQEAAKSLEDRVEAWGFPSDLGPESSTIGKDASAARGSQRIEQSADQLNPFLSSVAQSLDDLLDIVGDVIRELGVSVTLPVRRRAQGGSSRIRESVTIEPDDYKEQDRSVWLKSEPASTRFARRESNTNALKDGLMSRTRWLREEFDDYLQEDKQIKIDKMHAVADEKALETFIQFVDANGAELASRFAANQSVSPPPLAPQDGGPAEPGQPRRERPPEGATTGVGISEAPVEQSIAGAPPSLGEGVG